jgi:diadenosine tetraphosphate (Ap4A) HIT family hydrolase
MKLFECAGGVLTLPSIVLVDRRAGGHLIVDPPRKVWERSELTTAELTAWSVLVSVSGRAMLDALPVLRDGCINYWEAGNWSLHDDLEPKGPKLPLASRAVHLHLLGRSRDSADPDFKWGESPRWPAFADRHRWAAAHEPLTTAECALVVARVSSALA